MKFNVLGEEWTLVVDDERHAAAVEAKGGDVDEVAGFTSHLDRLITITEGWPPVEQRRIILHELGHVIYATFIPTGNGGPLNEEVVCEGMARGWEYLFRKNPHLIPFIWGDSGGESQPTQMMTACSCGYPERDGVHVLWGHGACSI